MVVYQLRSQSSELDAEEINQLLGMHQWDLLLDAGETCRMELAIAQRIVDRHHGRIWADDCPDWGICLSFSLPAPLGT